MWLDWRLCAANMGGYLLTTSSIEHSTRDAAESSLLRVLQLQQLMARMPYILSESLLVSAMHSHMSLNCFGAAEAVAAVSMRREELLTAGRR